jgi:hypothetical protein
MRNLRGPWNTGGANSDYLILGSGDDFSLAGYFLRILALVFHRRAPHCSLLSTAVWTG